MQLHATHATFPSIFISRIISILLDDTTESNLDTIEPDSKTLLRGAIYSEYLARWVTWAARTWTDESEHGTNLRKEVILQIAPAFIPGQNSGLKVKMYDQFTPFLLMLMTRGSLNELLQAISVGSKDLEECVELLRSTVVVVPVKVRELYFVFRPGVLITTDVALAST